MLDKKGFDLWAGQYDEEVRSSDETDTYPFAGYEKVISAIFLKIAETPDTKVLDLGFGTGRLTCELYKKGLAIYGQDFSKKMVELAQEKMPAAHLYEGDFSEGLVKELRTESFDYIVATYSLHHLTDQKKVKLLRSLLERLNEHGKILIGDVMFRTREDMDGCRKETGDAWDEEEIYIVTDELKNEFPDLVFTPVSFCAGILEIDR